MKKIDGFLLTILIIVAGLSGVYYYANNYLSYFDNSPELKARYERKKNLDNLAKKLKNLEHKNTSHMTGRSIASVPAAPSETEVSVDAEILSESYFKSAKSKCYEEARELDCLKIIEKAVTHYPESEWTGESLVLLTDFYYRTKRISHARDILKILKQDFKSSKSIQEKVIIIERHLI